MMLTDLVLEGYEQVNLFMSGADQRLAVLYKTIGKLNRRRDRVRLTNQSFNPDRSMKQQFLSTCYTTKWKDILLVE
jgi:DNA polymerase V